MFALSFLGLGAHTAAARSPIHMQPGSAEHFFCVVRDLVGEDVANTLCTPTAIETLQACGDRKAVVDKLKELGVNS